MVTLFNKTILIFDDSISVDAIHRIVARYNLVAVYLFPLTENIAVINHLKESLQSKEVHSVTAINTSAMVDEQVSIIREKISKWSADIGEYGLLGRKVKEWFLLPGNKVSSWWFSLVSEKNPTKTSAFINIAQVHSIEAALSQVNYDLCIYAVSNKALRKSIMAVTYKYGVKSIKISGSSSSVKKRIPAILEESTIGNIVGGFYILYRFFKRSMLSKRLLGPLEKRFPDSASLLFVSYFPALEHDYAHKGIFRNLYAPKLQEKLKGMNIRTAWLMMYVPIDGNTYADAVKIANKFTPHNETIFMLEEFLNIKYLVKGLLVWLWQIMLSFFIFEFLKKKCAIAEPASRECIYIIRNLWRSSFCGYTGLEGILYFFAFSRVFSRIPNITDCLYYSEMHAWEKALNAAKLQKKPNVRSIGFQHAYIAKNHFFYFYDPKELQGQMKAADMPMPDLIACNGEYMCSLLSKASYPHLVRVEALRYLYMNNFPINKQPNRNKNTLLVAGSILKNESANLISIINGAFPLAKDLGISFKGHPLMPFEPLFQELCLDISKTGYKIRSDAISKLLMDAEAVLVISSVAAIEALFFGCEVIMPSFTDSINMSPLVGFEEYYHKVTSSEDLQKTIEEIRQGLRLNDIEKSRRLIKYFWDLEDTLPKWQELLSPKVGACLTNKS